GAKHARDELFELRLIPLVSRDLARRQQRGETCKRRNARHGKLRLAPCITDQRVEVFAVYVEREAAIPRAVLVATGEAVAVIAEKHRAWSEHSRTLRGAVLEGAAHDGSNGERAVLLLERAIQI